MKSYDLINTKEKLAKINQEDLLRFSDRLSKAEVESLCSQVEKLDIDQFLSQRDLVIHPKNSSYEKIQSFDDFFKKGSNVDLLQGKKMIEEGLVGCLVVAGGQGTRLRFNGPKGMFPVTLIQHKSLFQLLSEKVLAASVQAKRLLPIAIMTSPENHQETISFFKEHHYFGLKPSQVAFFPQGELPLLTQQGNLFLESPAKIAQGPDGNGTSLKHFVKQGVFSSWYQQGIRYLHFILIDNALADPFDAELVGFQHHHQADVVMKCVERHDPQEKVGVVVKQGTQVGVLEYSELPADERDAVDETGSLRHRCANISLFCFKMDFVKEVVEHHEAQIPFHKALKAVKYLSAEGKTMMAESPMAWKFEKFIFDILPFAKQVKVLLSPRNECFAPLKNFSGPDSIVEVQKALQHYDRRIYAEVTGIFPPEKSFELSPRFYYPTPELLAKWKGKALSEADYIEG